MANNWILHKTKPSHEYREREEMPSKVSDPPLANNKCQMNLDNINNINNYPDIYSK